MKLDHDFVRNILLKIEDCNKPGGIENEEYRELMADNNKSFNELAYTIQKLIEGNIISGKVLWGNNQPAYIQPANLTFRGHEYLDNIRDTKIWHKTKTITSKFSSVSIDIMSKVAAELISKSLGLN